MVCTAYVTMWTRYPFLERTFSVGKLKTAGMALQETKNSIWLQSSNTKMLEFRVFIANAFSVYILLQFLKTVFLKRAFKFPASG